MIDKYWKNEGNKINNNNDSTGIFEEAKKESFDINNVQFGDLNVMNKGLPKNEEDTETKEFSPTNFLDMFGEVIIRDNFTVYFNSPVFSYSVDTAISLIKQVNRNIALTELSYPELEGKIEFKFIINSVGGDVIQGLRLFDAIKANKYPITTIASGMAASMGIITLVAGATVKAVEHTVLLIHPLSAGVQGEYYRLQNYMKLYTDLQSKLTNILIQNSNAKKEDIEKFMTGDSFILAPEAKTLGIIDEVIPTI